MKESIKINTQDFWGVGKQQPFKSAKLTLDKKPKSSIMSLGQGEWNIKPFSWTKDKPKKKSNLAISLTQNQNSLGIKPFSWTKDKPISKKNMNYKQAHQFFSLSPIGDTDKDGVPNWRDCRPYDSKKQGKHIDAFKKTLKKVIPKTATKSTTKPEAKQTTLDEYVDVDTGVKKQPVWHIFVKFPNEKWKNVGSAEQGNIKNMVNEYKQTFDNVEDIKVSQDIKMLGQLNRSIMYRKAKKAVTEYVERKGEEMSENVQSQFKPREPFQQPSITIQQTQAPQSQYPQYQQEIPQQQQQYQRKIPPGAQRYAPVTMEQSTIRKPMLRAPFQDRQMGTQYRSNPINPARHTAGPIRFKQVKFHNIRL